MSWHILGAGSMGCLWASLLRAHGHAVTLLLRDRATATLFRRAGELRVERDGQTTGFDCSHEVIGELGDAPTPGEHCSLIVSTKAYDTLGALRALAAWLPRYRAIVFIQNGMGTLEEVAEEFPALPLFVGVTAQGAWRRSRFEVVHAGEGPTWFGCPGGGDAALLDDLLALDCPTGWDAAIVQRMWIKLAINAVINGLTVVHHCRNGEILRPELRPRIEQLCAEAQQVLSRELPELDGLDLVAEVVAVATATQQNFSSMLQDLQQGRRSELDYINGYLCRAGARHDIALPGQRALLDELRALLVR